MNRHAEAVRIGVFGLLGAGNLGNDASLEVLLAELTRRHPNAIIDAFCSVPAVVRRQFGVAATAMHWNRGEYATASSAPAMLRKLVGKIVDAARTARWVRRHDVVIVPGMGVLEASVPLRPWGFPYSLLLLCASGRLLGTPVALVCVGAGDVPDLPTRLVLRFAGRLAHYRSYRDEPSREAMSELGVDTSADEIYADLVFALDLVGTASPRPGTVGVGVMDYRGGSADRASAAELARTYRGNLRALVQSLLEDGRHVLLFTGDPSDAAVAAEIAEGLSCERLRAVYPATLHELAAELASAEVVVASRYHHLVCALKLGRPTISLGYGIKHDALMAEWGLATGAQSARSFDVATTLDRLRTNERRTGEIRRSLAERNRTVGARMDRQFDRLSELIAAGRRVS